MTVFNLEDLDIKGIRFYVSWDNQHGAPFLLLFTLSWLNLSLLQPSCDLGLFQCSSFPSHCEVIVTFYVRVMAGGNVYFANLAHFCFNQYEDIEHILNIVISTQYPNIISQAYLLRLCFYYLFGHASVVIQLA